MPTLIGVFFFALGLYFFLFREQALLGLLIVASVFQAASAVNLADRGIQPCYIVAAFIILRAFLNRSLGLTSGRSLPEVRWLLLFGMIAVASAFILPVVFAGIPVCDPKIGIDDSLLIKPPLSFSLNNAAQAGFLAWHIGTAYSILSISSSAEATRRGFLLAFYLLVGVVFAQAACQLIGIPFPNSLFLNNPGYALWDDIAKTSGTRNPGTFSEPSMAGGFLVFYCVGFTAEYLSKGRGAAKALLALLTIGAVASSGSFLALGLCMLALFLRYLPFRIPWHMNLLRARRLCWLLCVLAVPAVLVLIFSAGYRETLFSLTVTKGDSGSFVNRTAADLYALQLLNATHYIGVGMGSNRSSSLLATLLSNVGVVGVGTLGLFYTKLMGRLSGENAWLRWGAYALLVDMFIGIADITFPFFWITVFLAIYVSGLPPVVGRKENASRAVPSQHGLPSLGRSGLATSLRNSPGR